MWTRGERREGGQGAFWGGLALGGILGAGLTYLFDPAGGRRRRALLRDKAVRAAHEAEDATERSTRDLANRSRGLFARLRGRRERVGDRTLEERVRAQLGHVCSHARAIAVKAEDGCVELKGPILDAEHDRVIEAVEAIPGVRAIDDDLERHAEPGNIPALQP